MLRCSTRNMGLVFIYNRNCDTEQQRNQATNSYNKTTVIIHKVTHTCTNDKENSKWVNSQLAAIQHNQALYSHVYW